MPDLDPEEGAAGRAGRVAAARRAAQPAALGIGAVLVLDGAVQDEDFLAAGMGVKIDAHAGGQAEQADLLMPMFVQGQEFDAGSRARLPRCGVGIERNLLGVVGGELLQLDEDRRPAGAEFLRRALSSNGLRASGRSAA